MMKSLRKSLSLLLIAGLLGSLTAMPAMAEGEASPITGIYLYASLNLETDSAKGTETLDLYPTTSGHYAVTSYSFVNECATWDKSQTPRLKVQLTADEGYYFDSLSMKDITLSGNAQRVDRLARENGGKLLNLTISFPSLSRFIGAPTNLRWSASGIAMWDTVKQADLYEVTLYRSAARVGQAQIINGTSCDFSKKLAKQATSYTFQVRAIDRDNNSLKSDPAISPIYTVTSEIAQALKDGKLGWKQDSNGWYYYNLDGSYPQSCWQEIDGKQYYFDESGYMLSNTTTPDGSAVDENGVKITG